MRARSGEKEKERKKNHKSKKQKKSVNYKKAGEKKAGWVGLRAGGRLIGGNNKMFYNNL